MNFDKDVCIDYIKENYTDFHEKRNEKNHYLILSECQCFYFGFYQDINTGNDLIYFKYYYDTDIRTAKNPDYYLNHKQVNEFNYKKIKEDFFAEFSNCFYDEETDSAFMKNLEAKSIIQLEKFISNIEKGLSYKQLLIDLPNKQRKEQSLLKI